MDLNRLGESVGMTEEERAIIIEYVKALETGPTIDHCLCKFREVTPAGSMQKQYVMEETHEDCPVHTREGFLLGFLRFTAMQAKQDQSWCKHGILQSQDFSHFNCALCFAEWKACVNNTFHGQPFRYCSSCGWQEGIIHPDYCDHGYSKQKGCPYCDPV